MEVFRVGDKVIVTNCGLQSYGLTGIITDHYNCFDTIRVSFEDWHGQGVKELVFRRENISKIINNDEGNNIMSVKGNYDVAMVKFVRGTNTTKEYAFALFDKNIYENDLVLCDTENGYGVAKVIRIVNQNGYEGIVTKEIICKVDFTAFENRKELRRYKESLKKQMDKIVADNQELILYQAIAEKNPEMAGMLKAYKELGDV